MFLASRSFKSLRSTKNATTLWRKQALILARSTVGITLGSYDTTRAPGSTVSIGRSPSGVSTPVPAGKQQLSFTTDGEVQVSRRLKIPSAFSPVSLSPSAERGTGVGMTQAKSSASPV